MAGGRLDFRRHGAGELHTAKHHTAKRGPQGRGFPMTWVLVTVMVVGTALSDLLQSYEMKRAGAQSGGARRGPPAAADCGTPLPAALDCVLGVLVFRVYGAGASGAAQLCGARVGG